VSLVGRDSKSYYSVFGRVNGKRGLLKLLPEQAKGTGEAAPKIKTHRCLFLYLAQDLCIEEP